MEKSLFNDYPLFKYNVNVYSNLGWYQNDKTARSSGQF